MKAIFLLGVILSLGWGSMNAGPLLPISVSELTETADVIVHGIVQSKKVARDASGRIYTQVKIEITEVWKGDVPGATFEIVHGGGILGNRKVTAPYQVDYEMGEEVLVFCVLNEAGKGVTIGLVQGKWEIQTAADSGRKYVRNVFHGGPPPDPNTTSGVRSRMPNRLPLLLESVKAEVRGGER